MTSLSASIHEPVRAPTPPRRPPRPVGFLPIVPEYPPSIRNASLDHQESCIRPASQWSSDDDDVMRRRCTVFFGSQDEPARITTPPAENADRPRARWTRRCVVLGVVVLVIGLVAGVVGGILGNRGRSNHEGDGGRGARPATSGLSGSPEQRTSATDANPTGSSRTGTARPTEIPTILKSSKVASALAMPFEDPYRLAAYLTPSGNLATAIWTGDTLQSFLLRAAPDDDSLPKPASSSPLHLIVLTQSDMVHILYVDEDDFLCLATMPARSGPGAGIWKGGRLETGDEGTENSKTENHQVSGDMRLAFETHNNAEDIASGRPADRVNILYQDGSKKHGGKDKYTLLSSTAPEDASQWSVSRHELSEGDKESMDPQKGSQGFAFAPIFKDPGKQSGIRVLWDLSNEDHDASLGMMKCKVKSPTELNGCWSDMGHWGSEDYHDKVLSMPKPLDLTIQPLPTDKSSTHAFVLLVIDGSHALTELYWDGSQWDGMRRFLAAEDKSVNATRSFTSISVTPDGHLFGVSDGKLRWYQRIGDWWEGSFRDHDAAWKLIEVLNTTLVDAGRDGGRALDDLPAYTQR